MLPTLLLLSALSASPASPASPASHAPIANMPVAELDLQRYSGQWHEIARLPMFFQRQCKDRITATYRLLADGSIEVKNVCRRADGKFDSVLGEARAVAGKPGALEVRFAPRWLSWLPMVWADYWVVDLDPEYQWAVVGGPSRDYLWILSRKPAMDAGQLQQIKQRAAARGYPVAKLIVN